MSANDPEPRPIPALTSAWLRSCGVELAYDKWVADRATQVRGTAILLHGGGQTRHSWGETPATLVSDGWNVIAYDARGHGDSSWATGDGYVIDRFVDDLVSVVELAGEPSVLIGASLGGITSLLGLGEGRIQAPAVVLVDVTPSVNKPGVDRIHAFMLANPEGFSTLEDVADAVRRYNPNRARGGSLDGIKKNVRQRENGRWYWHWDPDFILPSAQGRTLAPAQRLTACAEALDIPVMLVHGVQSDVVTGAEVEALRRSIPHARVQRVDAGHMVAGDDNTTFTAGLQTFLHALPRAACS